MAGPATLCALCGGGAGAAGGHLGPLLGPVPGAVGGRAFVHRECALWSPEVSNRGESVSSVTVYGRREGGEGRAD